MSPTPQEQKDSFLENGLQLIKQCPLCQQEYTKASFQVIEKNDETRLVHLTCEKCAQGMIAMFLYTRLGVSSIGILTDLNAQEVGSLRKREMFSENDILDFHNYLNHNKFSNLFV